MNCQKKPRSKDGCLTCRHRKTKCSEDHPRCMNCVKSGFECVWSDLKLPHNSHFKPKRTPRKLGVNFIFYGEKKKGNVGRKVGRCNQPYAPVQRKVNFANQVDDFIISTIEDMKDGVGEKVGGVHLVESNLQNDKSKPVKSVSSTDLVNQTVGSPTTDEDDEDDDSATPMDDVDQHITAGEMILMDEVLMANSPTAMDEDSTSNSLCRAFNLIEYDSTSENQLLDMFKFPDQQVMSVAKAIPVDSKVEDDTELGNLHSSNWGLMPTPFSGYKSWIPGVEYTRNDPLFLHAFVNGFVPAISPQRCHPQLTPMAVFMPQGIVEPMMREVFYACGAAFIANSNSTMQPVARRRYARCLTQFANRLTETGGLIEEWMVAAALLFTLRDKFIGSSAKQPTTHLAKAVELIRVLRKSTGDRSVTLKFFVDSFLFNYSVVILTGGTLAVKILPSPFDIYDEWRSVYEFQPFNCYVPWMNNPVVGAATKSFELAAKALWLVHRTPLCDSDMVIACELLAESYRLETPKPHREAPTETMLPREILQVQESVAVNDVCNLLCQLLLVRLMHPTLDLLHDVVRARVRPIFDLMHTLSADTPLWVICSWLLMVAGLSAELDDDRDFVLINCQRAARLFRAHFLVQVSQFLRKAWGSSLEPGPGWNLLFDPEAVLEVCL